MRIRVLSQYAALALSVALLTIGYLGAGHWWVGLAFLVLIAFWLGTRGPFPATSRSGLLVGLVAAAANGILMDLSPFLMGMAVTAGLAGWDLMNFNQHPSPVPNEGPTVKQVITHLWSIGLVLVISTALLALAGAVDLRLSFGLAGLLIAAAIAGLLLGIRSIKSNTNRLNSS